MKKEKSAHTYGFDEQDLNPAPYKYRVFITTKSIFLIFFVLGLGSYIYMVAEKRLSQRKYLRQNQMAAIKLIPSYLSPLVVNDPIVDQSFDLNSHLGSWTLLNIWATWCPPCQEEMPSLELLQKHFGKNLAIIALSVDEDVEVIKNFIKNNNPSFKVLWDKDRVSQLAFGVQKYPETFLISPDGQLIAQFSGPRDWASEVSINYFSDILNLKRR